MKAGDEDSEKRDGVTGREGRRKDDEESGTSRDALRAWRAPCLGRPPPAGDCRLPTADCRLRIADRGVLELPPTSMIGTTSNTSNTSNERIALARHASPRRRPADEPNA
ncbi:hypothetical protein WS69_25725 [Burkholderia sp. BDU5]|nr:hypothetical protein WS69_25725 [Burkholderia sp. BDU5]